MRYKFIFMASFIFLLCFISSYVEAVSINYRTAAEIKSQSLDPIGKVFCLGFIDGVLDTSSVIEPDYVNSKICTMKEISSDQTIRIVLGYIESHPELSKENAIPVILKAFIEAFPCPSKSLGKS